uniref:Uncharacterized protein n=1 Tax=Trichobilharzia regenti TaxID=157069 RepID=A0AA85JS59_TRIRE|nr:unnamed protein product [Trichobilharzia regenti]
MRLSVLLLLSLVFYGYVLTEPLPVNLDVQEPPVTQEVNETHSKIVGNSVTVAPSHIITIPSDDDDADSSNQDDPENSDRDKDNADNIKTPNTTDIIFGSDLNATNVNAMGELLHGRYDDDDDDLSSTPTPRSSSSWLSSQTTQVSSTPTPRSSPSWLSSQTTQVSSTSPTQSPSLPSLRKTSWLSKPPSQSLSSLLSS